MATDTPHISLRPLSFNDAKSLMKVFTDSELLQYWSRGPVKHIDELREYMTWNVENEKVQSFAIVKVEEPQDALGWVALVEKSAVMDHIGIILRASEHGNGYATTALRQAIDICKEERQKKIIEADIDPENKKSIALFEKSGFKKDRIQKGAWQTHLGVRDSVFYTRRL